MPDPVAARISPAASRAEAPRGAGSRLWSPRRVVVGFGRISLAADMVYEGAGRCMDRCWPRSEPPRSSSMLVAGPAAAVAIGWSRRADDLAHRGMRHRLAEEHGSVRGVARDQAGPSMTTWCQSRSVRASRRGGQGFFGRRERQS